MLVRWGTADSVPQGQDLARVRAPRHPRALPSGARPEHTQPQSGPERLYEPAYVHEAQADVLRLQRACEAYRASELIQPRPGLFLRVKA
ncbi:MAG TPA: hypothetical protein VFN67_15730 [Polyangiales bacterium]|nr:hypothetical protein [Polyangiales bacterium]